MSQAIPTEGGTSGAPPTILDVLGAIRMAVAQMRLYPKESPQVVKTVGGVHQAVTAFMGEGEALVLASAAEGLLINGKPLQVRDAASTSLESALVTLLQDAGIKSFRIPWGVQSQELVTFLHAFAKEFWGLTDGKEINSRLQEAGAGKITVDEVEYVEVDKDDLLIKDAASILEQAGLVPHDFLQLFDSRIESLAAEGHGSELRLEVLRKLLDQDPSLLQKLPSEESHAGLLRDAQTIVNFAQTRDVLQKIGKAYPHTQGDERAALRSAAHALLEGFKAHRKLIPAMRQLLGQETPELLPDWMSQAPESGEEHPAVGRTLKILAMTSGLQAESLSREGEPLLRELLELGDTDLAYRVTDSLATALAEGNATKRRLASETLLSMTSLLEATPLSKFRDRLEEKVRSALDQETDPRAYSRLTELAGSLSDSRLRKGEVNQALRLLDVLKKHSMIKDAAFPERSRLVLPALEKVTAGEGYKLVAGALKPMDATSTRLQQAIDTAAMQFLVAEMRHIESLSERLRVGETVAKVGDAAVALLADEAKKATVPSEALRLVEVLPAILPTTLAEETLAHLVSKHPVLSVRRRAAMLLAEKGYLRSSEILIFAFTTETDMAARAAFAEALARLKSPDCVGLLLEGLNSRQEPDEIRAACALALAKAGISDVVPILAELCDQTPKGFTRIFKTGSSTLKVAAARALGNFLSDDVAKKALNRALADTDQAVRAAAKLALNPPPAPPSPPPSSPAPAKESATPANPVDAGCLSGMLHEISLDQICQMLSGGQKTGPLRLNIEGGQGVVWFKGGKVVGVEYQDLKNQAALNALIQKKSGVFLFKAQLSITEMQPPAPLEPMLMEAFRVADESSRKAAAPPA